MSRHLRDLLTLIGRSTYEDDYGVRDSELTVCRICDNESGAGVLRRVDWHKPGCPIPRLETKYADQLYRRSQHGR